MKKLKSTFDLLLSKGFWKYGDVFNVTSFSNGSRQVYVKRNNKGAFVGTYFNRSCTKDCLLKLEDV